MTAETRNRIGHRIRELRGEMSQADLAAKAGTRQGTLSEIETGQVDVGLDLLTRIAAALGTTVELIRGEGKKL